MPRSAEYQHFLDFVTGKCFDSLPKDIEKPASKQELGWWKQYQVRRAIGHARRGRATKTELTFLAKKGFYYSGTPKEYRRKAK